MCENNEVRRVRMYYLPIRQMLDLHKLQPSRRVELRWPDEVPPGATVVSCHNAYDRCALAFIVRHPSFEEVEDGCEMPCGGSVIVQSIATENKEFDVDSLDADELVSLRDRVNERLYDISRKGMP